MSQSSSEYETVQNMDIKQDQTNNDQDKQQDFDQQDDSDDSLYQDSNIEEELEEESGFQIERKGQMTQQEINSLFEEIKEKQLKQQQSGNIETFKDKQETEDILFQIQTDKPLQANLFADYAVKANNNLTEDEQLQQLQIYAPKIITMAETKKFWNQYKNQLSKNQLESLEQYIKNQEGYLAKQEFINRQK